MRSSCSDALTYSRCPNTLKVSRCRCSAVATAVAADMSRHDTYWPSQRTASAAAAAVSGRSLSVTTAGCLQRQRSAHSSVSLHVFTNTTTSSSSSSSSNRSSSRTFQQQRSAVLTCSVGNGSGAYTSQQQAQLDTRQHLQIINQQQQQQQQPQDRPGAKTRLLQQRRVAAVREQQQQQQQWLYQQQAPPPPQQQQGYAQSNLDQHLVVPQRRFVLRSYKRFSGAWYKDSSYKEPRALHAAILQRCGTGAFEADALRHLLLIAASPRDCQLALSAVTAVRAVAVSQGRMDPWPDTFLKAFVKMCAVCECHEVLLSAMQRPPELGFVFKWKSLLLALKHWGDLCAVDKLEQIAFVMEDAGMAPDERMAYIIVRACVNSAQWDRIDRVVAWFSSKGVQRDEFRPAFLRLLEKAEAVMAAAAAGDGDGSVAAAAAAGDGDGSVAAAAAATGDREFEVRSNNSLEEDP